MCTEATNGVVVSDESFWCGGRPRVVTAALGAGGARHRPPAASGAAMLLVTLRAGEPGGEVIVTRLAAARLKVFVAALAAQGADRFERRVAGGASAGQAVRARAVGERRRVVAARQFSVEKCAIACAAGQQRRDHGGRAQANQRRAAARAIFLQIAGGLPLGSLLFFHASRRQQLQRGGVGGKHRREHGARRARARPRRRRFGHHRRLRRRLGLARPAEIAAHMQRALVNGQTRRRDLRAQLPAADGEHVAGRQHRLTDGAAANHEAAGSERPRDEGGVDELDLGRQPRHARIVEEQVALGIAADGAARLLEDGAAHDEARQKSAPASPPRRAPPWRRCGAPRPGETRKPRRGPRESNRCRRARVSR